MLSPTARRNIYRIIPFVVIWFVFGNIYAFIEKGILADATHYPSTGNTYSFESSYLTFAVITILTGVIVGTLEVLLLSKLFVRSSLSKKLIVKTLIYVLLIISFLFVNTLIINAVRLDVSVTDPVLWGTLEVFATNFAFISVSLYIAAVMFLTLFFSEVSENLGMEVLKNFLSGKYHKPRQEERIFMFVDMRDSTRIAEQLGHVKYFEMLNQYYRDISPPIINHEGEVYQYVGDEIIVSWKKQRGLKDDACIRCFFEMKRTLEKKKEMYLSKFGVLPTFKAGLHAGDVTTGEIGVIKKEIVFTGDVLNTTARIQALCNDYNVDLLVSEYLVNVFQHFSFRSLGGVTLRGRAGPTEIYTYPTESKD